MGCGRSGTHWLGHILDSHPDILATIEKPKIFHRVTALALNPSRKKELLPGLLRLYRKEVRRAHPKRYADKSHPTIWFAEELAEAFPSAMFVGIQRSAYGTIASMIRHTGVTEWTEQWREFPLPNKFLGIDELWSDDYDSLSLAAKHALRWKAHKDRLISLKATLGSRMHLLDYEQMQKDINTRLSELVEFLQLNEPFPIPEVKTESLTKWRQHLSEQDIEEINSLLSGETSFDNTGTTCVTG